MTTEKIYGPWIKWDGGECPVPPDTRVKVKFRCGVPKSEDRAGERLAWQAANDWAAAVGGTLPTGREQSLIHAHCRAHIKHAWHWSSESFEEDALRAGCCNFNYGYCGGEIKSFEFCAVAVRRIPIGGGV